MPKKPAPHRDGWTWELFKDMASRPKNAELLRTFVEMFANGKLPKPLKKFMSSAIMIPFHKLALIERDLLKDPLLRPITIGALLCKLSVRTVLRMKRKGIADRLLKNNQFSYGIPSGVQMVIMGCTMALQCNPSWCLLELDYANAHSVCIKGNIWEELERDAFFHFLI